MPSAVFDSTVLVSAFISKQGVASELIDLAGVSFDLFLSSAILAEVQGVLLSRPQLRKSGYSEDDVVAYCQALSELAKEVGDLPPLAGAVRDPNDVIVATALAAKAEYLVTRDKDLLSLGSYQETRIVSPEAFRGMLRGR